MTLATLDRGLEVLESLAEVFADEKPCEGTGLLDGACGYDHHAAEVWMRFACTTAGCKRVRVRACCKLFVSSVWHYADAAQIFCSQCTEYAASSDFEVMGEV
jgi:hypothetical protein